MVELTQEGQRIVAEAAHRHSMSEDAVGSLLAAVIAGGGRQAQFNHPELGGMGQWSGGGMIMIGDMFNNGLKSRVAALCADLAEIISRGGVIADRPRSGQWQSQGGSDHAPLPENSFFSGGAKANWYPPDLGTPASTGAQNNMRYACFPDRRRLALEVNGTVSIHDTGEHVITGFSQQQSGDQSLTFTSQHGVVRLDSLRRISDPAPVSSSAATAPLEETTPSTGPSPNGDIFDSIERLAGLRDKGHISDAEFAEKKTELLKRL